MSEAPAAKFYELIGILKAKNGDYEGALSTFSAGIATHPTDARLYRHRAHTYMNLRRVREAHDDFNKALEFLPQFKDAYEGTRVHAIQQLEAILLNGVEPDSQPDVAALRAAGQYHASLAFKIYYHLGVTQHMLGSNEEAAHSFERALEHSETLDLQVATLNWLVVVYGILGNETRLQELLAGVQFDSVAGVNGAYQDMLKVYKGLMSAEDLLDASRSDSRVLATSGYGLALLLLSRGDKSGAEALLERVASEGEPHAFGTVAAEIRLRELKQEILPVHG